MSDTQPNAQVVESFERLAVIARGIVQLEDGKKVIFDAYGEHTPALEVCRMMILDMSAIQSIQNIILGAFNLYTKIAQDEINSSGTSDSESDDRGGVPE